MRFFFSVPPPTQTADYSNLFGIPRKIITGPPLPLRPPSRVLPVPEVAARG